MFVPVNIRLAAPEVEFWLTDSGATFLFVDDQFLPVWEALKDRGTDVKHVLYIGDGELPEGLLDYEQLISEAAPVADADRGYEDLGGCSTPAALRGDPKALC